MNTVASAYLNHVAIRGVGLAVGLEVCDLADALDACDRQLLGGALSKVQLDNKTEPHNQYHQNLRSIGREVELNEDLVLLSVVVHTLVELVLGDGEGGRNELAVLWKVRRQQLLINLGNSSSQGECT